MVRRQRQCNRSGVVLFVVIATGCCSALVESFQPTKSTVSALPLKKSTFSKEWQASPLFHQHTYLISNLRQPPGPRLSKAHVSRYLSPGENDDTLLFRSASYDIFHAALVGIATGLSVACFKKAIDCVRSYFFLENNIAKFPFAFLVPAIGGSIVASLVSLGSFQPGLRGTVKRVDETSDSTWFPRFADRIKLLVDSMRKSAASAATIGTGCSLGPEGPCVEIGMSVARSCMDTSRRRVRHRFQRIEWNHRLLSCGAAAGVAAGFAAPLAGVFFALEVLQDAFDTTSSNEYSTATSNRALTGTARIAPILASSVFSALMAHTLLGEHFELQLASYSLRTPLLELPLYVFLGSISGGMAFIFSALTHLLQATSNGDLGPAGLRRIAKNMPVWLKPIIGGLFCGVVGIFVPQIRFFGSEVQNTLLSNHSLPNMMLLKLLGAKMIATAFSAASGLVGGTFAPSLFLGAVTGALYHNGLSTFYDIVLRPFALFSNLVIADLPAYTMIGAGSVLAALFRAPLTASLLLFEMTRDYDVILPLVVSAGFGSVVRDVLESKFQRLRIL